MSGSPIYIDGKLVGAVAFAWEFAKDPIAGVTPFQQMVQYVRANDRRIAAEAKDRSADEGFQEARASFVPELENLAAAEVSPGSGSSAASLPVAGGAVAGMTRIVTPLAATGFSPRA